MGTSSTTTYLSEFTAQTCHGPSDGNTCVFPGTPGCASEGMGSTRGRRGRVGLDPGRAGLRGSFSWEARVLSGAALRLSPCAHLLPCVRVRSSAEQTTPVTPQGGESRREPALLKADGRNAWRCCPRPFGTPVTPFHSKVPFHVADPISENHLDASRANPASFSSFSWILSRHGTCALV